MSMLKALSILLGILGAGLVMFVVVSPARAQDVLVIEEALIATESATASADASTSATIGPRVIQPDNDLTQPVGEPTDALTAFLEANPPQPLNWYNPLESLIRQAIANGLPANIVVILIMFPIIASIIAASRHIIGLQGFGVYTPAVLSVAFVSTGIATGIAVFIVVMLAATMFRVILRRMKLQYLPRTALLLWGVSLTVLIVLLLTGIYGVSSLFTITIFPLLIIILLTENFMETQLTSSQSQALEMTIETLVIAIICSMIISYQPLQMWVLLHPEITFAAVAFFNILIGKYSGLRLLEYIRFKSLLES